LAAALHIPTSSATTSPRKKDPTIMKLLLTSAGINNPSIHSALLDLLGKPIADSSALCIPTAAYGHPRAGPVAAWNWIAGRSVPMVDLGWKSLGVLELTALPSIEKKYW